MSLAERLARILVTHGVPHRLSGIVTREELADDLAKEATMWCAEQSQQLSLYDEVETVLDDRLRRRGIESTGPL